MPASEPHPAGSETGPETPPENALSVHLRGYTLRFLWGGLLLLLTNAAEKAIPWLVRNALDAFQARRFESVQGIVVWILAIAVVLWLVRTASRVVLFNIGRDVEYSVRSHLMAHLHMLGASFYRRMPTGDVMSRATNDLAQIRLLVGFGGLNVINSVFAFALSISLMLAISPKLTLWALIPFPLLIGTAQLFSRQLFPRMRRSQAALGKLAERAQENISGVRVIRSMGIEDRELARFEAANQEAVDSTMSVTILRGLMFPVLLGISSLGTLIVIWQGGQMVLEGDLTVGEFTAFNAYMGLLIWPILAFGYLLSIIQRGRAAWERVREILDARPDIEPPVDGRMPAGEGAISVRGLSFSHGESLVLKDVSFELPAGGSLAIVGPTGSGKSTLAELLPRLLPTPKGAVFLDGVDVTELDLRALRKAIGYAQQEPFLFSSTIEANLRFALPDPVDPEALRKIRSAAEEASVLEEVEQMPEGFSTVVGERGVQLSGGQKQRLSLARALLNEPAVLVLDDPMTAVDAKTEASILDALDRAKEGRSLILITNRIAAAARADRVIVLERGEVVERGTHEELIEGGGLYARLYARQQLEEELSSL